MVVVEQDGCVGLAVELLERRSGERLVHGHVPVAPRIVQRRVEVGRRAEPPEVVLQKPDGRIGKRVVEAVVDGLIVRDEPQPVRGPIRGLLVERSAILCRDGPVLLGHRARDPRHVVVCEQAAERRDDTAAAPLGHSVSALVARVGDRRAVEDDEKLTSMRWRF